MHFRMGTIVLCKELLSLMYMGDKEVRKPKTFKVRESVHEVFKAECLANGYDMSLVMDSLMHGFNESSQKLRMNK